VRYGDRAGFNYLVDIVVRGPEVVGKPARRDFHAVYVDRVAVVTGVEVV
jgi:hypothetical protein